MYDTLFKFTIPIAAVTEILARLVKIVKYLHWTLWPMLRKALSLSDDHTRYRPRYA